MSSSSSWLEVSEAQFSRHFLSAISGRELDATSPEDTASTTATSADNDETRDFSSEHMTREQFLAVLQRSQSSLAATGGFDIRTESVATYWKFMSQEIAGRKSRRALAALEYFFKFGDSPVHVPGQEWPYCQDSTVPLEVSSLVSEMDTAARLASMQLAGGLKGSQQCITAECIASCAESVVRDLSMAATSFRGLSNVPPRLIARMERFLASYFAVRAEQQDTAAGESCTAVVLRALVLLACASPSQSRLLNVILLLSRHSRDDVMLPVVPSMRRLVCGVLRSLTLPPIISLKHHLATWRWQGTESDMQAKNATEYMRHVTTDGVYLYTTDVVGRGVLRMGTGLQGTDRSTIYASDGGRERGTLAYVSGHLLHFKLSKPGLGDIKQFTEDDACLATMLDPSTLKPICSVKFCLPTASTVYSNYTLRFVPADNFVVWLWLGVDTETRQFKVSPQLGFQTQSSESQKAAISGPVFKVYAQRLELVEKDAGEWSLQPASKPVVLRQGQEGDLAHYTVDPEICAQFKGCESHTHGPDRTVQPGLFVLNFVTENLSCAVANAIITTTGHSIEMLEHVPVFSNGECISFLLKNNVLDMKLADSFCRTSAFSLDGGFQYGVYDSGPSDSPALQLTKLANAGACFDAINNCIWMVTDDLVHVWLNSGSPAPSCVRSALQHAGNAVQLDDIREKRFLPSVSSTADCAPVGDIKSLMFLHSTLYSLLETSGAMLRAQLSCIGIEKPLAAQCCHSEEFLKQLLELCESSLSSVADGMAGSGGADTPGLSVDSLCSCLHVLRMVVVTTDAKNNEQVSRMRCLCDLLKRCAGFSDSVSVPEELQIHAATSIGLGLDLLFPTVDEQRQLIAETLERQKSKYLDPSAVASPAQTALDILVLENIRAGFEDVEECGRPNKVAPSLANIIETHSDLRSVLFDIAAIETVDGMWKACQAAQAMEHLSSLATRALSALQRNILIRFQPPVSDVGTIGAPGGDQGAMDLAKDDENSRQALASHVQRLIAEAVKLMVAGKEMVEKLSRDEYLPLRLAEVNAVLEASIVGQLVPLLCAGLGGHRVCSYKLAGDIMLNMQQIIADVNEAASILCGKPTVKEERESAEGDAAAQEGEAAETEAETSAGGDTPNKTDLSIIPAPSLDKLANTSFPKFYRRVVTPHPCEYGTDINCAVQINDACRLFLVFDGRCATQTANDCLEIKVTSGGCSTSRHKFFGNSLYPPPPLNAWPKIPVEIAENNVTLKFKQRSTDNHELPVFAKFGFVCDIYYQTPQELDTKPPLLADVALSVTDLVLNLFKRMFSGPETGNAEEQMMNVMEASVLKRCIWKEPAMPVESVTSIVDLKANMRSLRAAARRHLPQIRPSIANAIDLKTVDSQLFLVCVRHLRLDSIVSEYLETTNITVIATNVLRIVFGKINELLTRIQRFGEIEKNWLLLAEDYTENQEMFFESYADEEKPDSWSLQQLCRIADVPYDPSNPTAVVSKLKEVLIRDRQAISARGRSLVKTAEFKALIQERCDILQRVPLIKDGDLLSVEKVKNPGRATPPFWRSLSAPQPGYQIRDETDSSVWRQASEDGASCLNPITHSHSSQPEHIAAAEISEDLVAFMSPFNFDTKACMGLCQYVENRAERENSRRNGIASIGDVLATSGQNSSMQYAVTKVVDVLQEGPRYDTLLSESGIAKVREQFKVLLKFLVSLMSRSPEPFRYCIAKLCVIPYKRLDASALSSSGLIGLCSELCDKDRLAALLHRSPMAVVWRGLQLLVNRVVSWKDSEDDEFKPSCLLVANQIAAMLATILSSATHLHDDGSFGALSSVLSLLVTLSKKSMGRMILSRPECVTKLLLLLCDHSPSPKLVLMVLQLCRQALPLMTEEDCQKIQLPVSFASTLSASPTDSLANSPTCQVVMFLLLKLGDYIVPGAPYTIPELTVETPARRRSEDSTADSAAKAKAADASEPVRTGLFIQLYRSFGMLKSRTILKNARRAMDDLKLGAGVCRLPREGSDKDFIAGLSYSHPHPHSPISMASVLAMTGTASKCQDVASRLADQGFSVCIGEVDDAILDAVPTGPDRQYDCLEKNREVAKSSPARPFISACVADTMAAEIIGSLREMLMPKEGEASKFWLDGIKKALTASLHSIKGLVPLLTVFASSRDPDKCERSRDRLAQEMKTIRLALAALSALGGFKQSIRPGSHVELVSDLNEPVPGVVKSIAEATCMAAVELEGDSPSGMWNGKRLIDVPLSRLRSSACESLPLERLDVTDGLLDVVFLLLAVKMDAAGCFPVAGSEKETPDCPEHPTNGAQQVAARLLAQFKTRASCVLSLHASLLSVYPHIAREASFIRHIAQEARPGFRLAMEEEHCSRLRMLYRDCSRPPAPPRVKKTTKVEKPVKGVRLIVDTKFCVVSDAGTTVEYFGKTQQPCAMLADTVIPVPASSFFFEVTLKDRSGSPGESSFQFGFLLMKEVKTNPPDTYPDGTTVFHLDGKLCCVGRDDEQPEGFSLEFNVGDTFGIGWEQDADAAMDSGGKKGTVFVTRNEERLEPQLKDVVVARTLPFIKMAPPCSKVHVNFGQEPFVYGPGAALRAATDVSMYYETQDLVSVFEELPFFYSEIDGEKQQSSVTTEEAQLEAEEQEEQEAAAAEEEERETQPQPDQTKTPEPRLQDGSQGLLIPDVSTSSIHQGASESVKTRWDAVTAGAGHQDQGSNKTGAKADAWDGESLEMTTPSSTVVQSPASHRLSDVGQVSPHVVAPAPEDGYGWRVIDSAHLSCQPHCLDPILHTGPSITCSATMGPAQLAEEAEGSRSASTRNKAKQHSDADIKELMLEAYKKHVFPIIRSRFRNEQERALGLEQLLGAITNDMFDEARMIIEFLYSEDGQGLPKSLKIPTVESVKEDLLKQSINNVSKGAAVQICREEVSYSESQTSSLGDCKDKPLPQFATPEMANTFGLTGIVQRVDKKESALVEVEVYIPTEGIIATFWYPASYLLPARSDGDGDGGISSPDAMNKEIHDCLLFSEWQTSILHCQAACIIASSCQAIASAGQAPPPLSAYGFLRNQPGNISQESSLWPARLVDEEALRLSMLMAKMLTEQLVASPTSEGIIKADNLTTSGNALSGMTAARPSLVNHMVSSPSTLASFLKALLQSKSYTLVQKAVVCQLSGMDIRQTTLSCTDAKTQQQVILPGAAAIAVSCQEMKTKREVSADCTRDPSKPFARVFISDARIGVYGDGCGRLREVVRYPNGIGSLPNYCGHRFPTLIVPGGEVGLILTDGAWLSATHEVVFTSVPSQLLTSVLYIHVLADQCSPGGRVEVAEWRAWWIQLLTQLVQFVLRANCPTLLVEALLLEVIFMIDTFRHNLGTYGTPGNMEKDLRLGELFPSLDRLLEHAAQELLTVAKLDVSRLTNPTNTEPCTATDMTWDVPTYCHTLVELLASWTAVSKFFQWSAEHVDAAFPKTFEVLSSQLVPLLAAIDDDVILKPDVKTPWLTSIVKVLEFFAHDPQPDDDDNSGSSQIVSPPTPSNASVSSTGDATPEHALAEHTAGRYIFLTLPLDLTISAARSLLLSLVRSQGGLRSLDLPSQQDVHSTRLALDLGGDEPDPDLTGGCALLELKVMSSAPGVVVDITDCKDLRRSADDKEGGFPGFKVEASSISKHAKLQSPTDNLKQVWENYLLLKLTANDQLRDVARDIFSCIFSEAPQHAEKGEVTRRSLLDVDCRLRRFFSGTRGGVPFEEVTNKVFREYGRRYTFKSPPGGGSSASSKKKKTDYCLKLEEFLLYITRQTLLKPVTTWQGLLAVSYDFNLRRLYDVTTTFTYTPKSMAFDTALVSYANLFAVQCGLTAKSLHPQDFFLTDVEKQNEDLAPLLDVSHQQLALCAGEVMRYNAMLAPRLSLLDLRLAHSHLGSLAASARAGRSRIFYSMKTEIINIVLNVSAGKVPKPSTQPEVTLNPLNRVGDDSSNYMSTQFAQAAQQLANVPSCHLCVPVASGGDPTFGFKVRFTGEEVMGTSGSFRHFLWTVVKELRTILPMFVECRSAATGKNVQHYTLHHHPVSFAEERLLQFFGQLLGIVMRADVPLPFDLTSTFWKSFLNDPLTFDDIKEVDVVLYKYLKAIKEASNDRELRYVLNPASSPSTSASSTPPTSVSPSLARDPSGDNAASSESTSSRTGADASLVSSHAATANFTPTTPGSGTSSRRRVVESGADPACPHPSSSATSSALVDKRRSFAEDAKTSAGPNLHDEASNLRETAAQAGPNTGIQPEAGSATPVTPARKFAPLRSSFSEDDPDFEVIYNSIGQPIMFNYGRLDGSTVEMIDNGSNIPLRFSNRHDYVQHYTSHCLEELTARKQMNHIQAGFATIVPTQILTIMSPRDLHLRISGQSEINLPLLKQHTVCQSGVHDGMPHIRFFWEVLESLTQAELSRFVKFACNQERLPVTCPCQFNPGSPHVPPYPMKLGPPDGNTSKPDSRFIRAETCMFLVKLPEYSSLDVARQKIMDALHCRDDPLFG